MAANLEFYNTYFAPVVDGAINIGSSSKQFGNLYINGKAYIDGLGENCLVDLNVELEFGDSAVHVSSQTDGHLDLTADISVDINVDTDSILVTAQDIGAFGSIPMMTFSSPGFALGSYYGGMNDGLVVVENNIAPTIILVKADASASASFSLDTTNGYMQCDTTFVPDTDDSLDLGTAAASWKDIYIDGIAYLTSINGALTVTGNTTITGELDVDSTLSDSSGQENGISQNVTVNQSGTAGYIGQSLNITESATGSGVSILGQWSVGGLSRFDVGAEGDMRCGRHLTIGMLQGADVDPYILFQGETNSGKLTWMEEEDNFKFEDKVSIAVSDSTLAFGYGAITNWSQNGPTLTVTEADTDNTMQIDGKLFVVDTVGSYIGLGGPVYAAANFVSSLGDTLDPSTASAFIISTGAILEQTSSGTKSSYAADSMKRNIGAYATVSNSATYTATNACIIQDIGVAVDVASEQILNANGQTMSYESNCFLAAQTGASTETDGTMNETHAGFKVDIDNSGNSITNGTQTNYGLWISTLNGIGAATNWGIYDESGNDWQCGGNFYPATDDTYYIGKNDDDSPFAWKGIILKDTTNGKYYRIEVINGTVTATDLTD